MKKFNFTFAVTAIVAAILFILSGAFCVGTTDVPRTYTLTSVKASGADVLDAYVTFDIDVERPSSDPNSLPVYDYVSRILIYVGEAYSADDDGNVIIHFDFKTDGGTDTAYSERITASVPSGGGRYNVFEVYDGAGSNRLDGLIRVKIHTPHSFEFYEAAFYAADGRRLPIKKTVNFEGVDGSKLHDEQTSLSVSSARAYRLTESECEIVEGIESLLTGGGYKGNKPLAVAAGLPLVALFGPSTFAVRLPSLIAGYFLILVLYMFIKRLFGSDGAAVLAALCFAALGALFMSSFTSAVLPVLFAVLAYYLTVGVFISSSGYPATKPGASALLMTGVWCALAVAADSSICFALSGIPAVWAAVVVRAYRAYKKTERAAEGLGKMHAYEQFRKFAFSCAKIMPTAFILIPAALTLLFYAITAAPAASAEGAPFFAVAASSFAKGFVVNYSVNPALALVGFASEYRSGAYYFLNAVPCLVCAASLLFTAIAVVFGGKGVLSSAKKGIFNKFMLISAAFIPSLIAPALGFSASIVGMTATAAFYSAYVPLCVTALSEIFDNKVVKIVYYAAIIAFALSAVVAFPAVAGIDMPGWLENISLWNVVRR